MSIHKFPPVEMADENGLLALGGDLEVPSLILAYSNGIFPWPVSDTESPILWFSPPLRSIIFISELHVSRSLKKQLKQKQFTFSIDQDFDSVIKSCSDPSRRIGQSGTWITAEMISAYNALHRAGFAHSVECRNLNGDLVGGLYGISIGKMFAGESMFCNEANASKCCLVKLVEFLKLRGCTWIDCQVENPLSRSFGARDLPRTEFIKMLQVSIKGSPMFTKPSHQQAE